MAEVQLCDGRNIMKIGITEISLGAAALYAIGSEVVGLNPKWQSNSLVQLAGTLLKRLSGK